VDRISLRNAREVTDVHGQNHTALKSAHLL
jgi:hypothetical protein